MSEPEEWAWKFDGIDLAVPNTYSVDVNVVTGAETVRQDIHLSEVDGRLYFFADCGDPIADPTATTVAPEASLVSIGGDDTSESFDAPNSWRVEATTTDFCLVKVIRDADGSTAEIKSGESDFTIQIREAGRFYVETSGCLEAVATEN